VGLSIGVHLLNLVTIPALALLYYFKKKKATNMGVIYTLAVGGIILVIINSFIIPGLPTIAGNFELLFVNTLGLPFGTGTIIFSVLFLGALVYGIRRTYLEGKPLMNTALLCLAFILIGYSSYAIVVIRSNFNPPIDENNPQDIMSFVSYLKREQYGDRPLIYGQFFTADVIDQKQGSPIYYKGDDKYEIAEYRLKNVYDPAESTILPRAYSTSDRHAQIYRQIMGLPEGKSPSFVHNMKFMFRHQINHMYWRYFMWNFSGRESDIQDAGWLGFWHSSSGLPEVLKNNKARNNYFMLPLFLGILGLFFQYRKDFQSFFFVMMLFLMMGLVLVLYLNSPPVEPRERDYIYVGSFYAFAFWIGFGVLALYELLGRALRKQTAAALLATLICLSVPGIMLAQNWDDHDRSNRYFSVDSARNMLSAMEPNGILFTGGDNDTFPLWYVQEVEGFRTDVRVVVLSYFNTDWYIEQMTRATYESQPFPFSLTIKNYRTGINDYLPLVERENLKAGIPARQFINLIREDNPGLKLTTQSGKSISILPSKTFFLDVDTTKVLSMGIIPESLQPYMVSRMDWQLNASYMEKGSLMLLDLLVNNNWERPLYFNNTSLITINHDLRDYMVQEGTVYRLLPVKRPENYVTDEMVNTEKMYDVVMNKFQWRGLDDPKVYNSQDYRFFVLNHRTALNNLAGALIGEGKMDKAKEVALENLRVMPDKGVYYDFATLQTVEILFRVGEKEKAVEVAEVLARRADEMLAYMVEIDREIGNELRLNMVTLINLQRMMRQYNLEELAQKYENMVNRHYTSSGLNKLLN
jgi:hypothetical protein